MKCFTTLLLVVLVAGLSDALQYRYQSGIPLVQQTAYRYPVSGYGTGYGTPLLQQTTHQVTQTRPMMGSMVQPVASRLPVQQVQTTRVQQIPVPMQASGLNTMTG